MCAQNKPAIRKTEYKEYYPASPAQGRLYFEQMLNRESIAYNINGAFEIAGELNPGKLKDTFQLLIDRHEGLRTGFMLLNDGVMQKISKQISFELLILEGDRYYNLEAAFTNFVRPFDLSGNSLLRCGIFTHREAGNFLLVDMHHIIADGISLNILMADFKRLYRGEQLPLLPFRYADYAVWQKHQLKDTDRGKAYWERILSGQSQGLNLPILGDRSLADGSYASISALEIEESLYDQIRRFAASSNVSEYMFLLSVYYILLARVSGSSDIIIGTDVIGRNRSEWKDIAGTFINLLPLRVRVNPQASYRELLTEVGNCVLDAFDNQEYQFDQMVLLWNKLGNDRTGKIFDVHFSFANYQDAASGWDDLDFIKTGTGGYLTTQYEFKIEVTKKEGVLNIAFIYSTALYDATTIDCLMNYYYNIMTCILNDPAVLIKDIKMESRVGQLC